jgi:hypothetical protein
MYPPLLGRFYAPARNHWSASPHWVTDVQYQPEPPILVRGSMNPWADERQREVFNAEEQTWTKIQVEQKTYRAVLRQIDAKMAQFNDLIRQVEGITGKKSQFGEITTYAALAYSLSGGPYGLLVSLGKMVLDFGLGMLAAKKKKKKLNKLVQQIEQVQAELTALTAQIDGIQKKVHDLIQTGDRIRNSQEVRVSQDWQNSESLYAKRVSLDRQRADVLRERNRQVALWQPKPSGGDYANI